MFGPFINSNQDIYRRKTFSQRLAAQQDDFASAVANTYGRKSRLEAAQRVHAIRQNQENQRADAQRRQATANNVMGAVGLGISAVGAIAAI